MSQRSDRVADVLLKNIARVLREEVQNPKIGFVTILRVEVTDDLRMARIYYSVLGTEDEKKTTDIELKNSAKFIKRVVNEDIDLRYAVDLRFIRETSIDESIRLQKIFDKINKERQQKPAAETDEEK